MAVHPHLRIVFRGVFLNTPEEWSFSTKFSKDNDQGADATVADIDAGGLQSALGGLFINSMFSNWVRCMEWRAYEIGSNGKMVGNPRLVPLATGSQPTGLGQLRYPTDQAICVTTEAANRGHARYGRFYLPTPNLAFQTDGRLGISDATNLMTVVTTFVKSVSDSIDLPVDPFEGSSMLNISNDASATHQVVRNLRIGRVLDRVSRRRRSLLEEHVETGVIDW